MIAWVFLLLPTLCYSLVVGISGGSGSGKTTFAETIQQILGSEKCSIIHLDNYYKPLSQLPDPPNFDEPSAFDFDLLHDHLSQLKNGSPIDQPLYNFMTGQRNLSTKLIPSTKIIIVEGFLVFSIPSIRDLLDLKIYLEVDTDIQFIRQLERDMNERKRSYLEVKDHYLNQVKPAYCEYVSQAKKFADLIIPYDKINQNAIDVLITYLNDSRN